jgi:glutathione S-transferase
MDLKMYRLWGKPGKASAAPEGVLEEVGARYEYVEVDLAHAGNEYAQIHPLRRVPALGYDNQIVWEAAAICLAVAERHPEAGLLPPAGTSARASVYQWLHFFSSELQPTYMLAFYPQSYCDDPAGTRSVRERACARLPTLWQVVERAITGTFLVEDALTVCDFYATMLGGWHVELEDEVGASITGVAGCRSMFGAVARRPSGRRMLERNLDHALHERLLGSQTR